jgi:hypothetical protein
VRLAVGDLVEQRRVEEDVAGQQVQQVDAQQDVGRNAPSAKPVRDARGNRGIYCSKAGIPATIAEPMAVAREAATGRSWIL